jgi:hypothetical protein
LGDWNGKESQETGNRGDERNNDGEAGAVDEDRGQHGTRASFLKFVI